MRFVTVTLPHLTQALLSRHNWAFALCMDFTFMLATFVTLKVTKSHWSQAIQANLDATDKTEFSGTKVTFQTVPIKSYLRIKSPP